MYLVKLMMEKLFFPFRFQYLTKLLLEHLGQYTTVLDIGAGDGQLAFNIQKKLKKTKFTGIDTVIQSKTFIPVKKYNGRKLPFKSKSFDCVMLIDTLHHDTDIHAVLKEAKRVSKKGILIKDHYYTNLFSFQLLKIADWFGNKAYKVSLPYNFLKLTQWEELFKNNKLNIISRQTFRYNKLDPAKHVIFKLEKD